MAIEDDPVEPSLGEAPVDRADLIAALVLVGIVLLIGIIAVVLRYAGPEGPNLPTPAPTVTPVLPLAAMPGHGLGPLDTVWVVGDQWPATRRPPFRDSP